MLLYNTGVLVPILHVALSDELLINGHLNYTNTASKQ